MKETIPDFWKMIWEQESNTIVLLCTERVKLNIGISFIIIIFYSQDDCPQFHPMKLHETSVYGNYLVILESVVEEVEYIIYSFVLATKVLYEKPIASTLSKMLYLQDHDKHNVTLFSYNSWYEHTKPQTGSSLLNMFDTIVKNQTKTGNKPITVVCK